MKITAVLKGIHPKLQWGSYWGPFTASPNLLAKPMHRTREAWLVLCLCLTWELHIFWFSAWISIIYYWGNIPQVPIDAPKGCLWDPVSRLWRLKWRLIEAWHDTDTTTPWPASRIDGLDWNSEKIWNIHWMNVFQLQTDHARRPNNGRPDAAQFNRKVTMDKVNYLTRIFLKRLRKLQ